MNLFKIKDDYITLGQFLKANAYIGSGGEAKFFLLEKKVFVNQEHRIERGKKLYPGDIIKIDKDVFQITHD